MMDLTSASAAESWALFSGDWNPIHFDINAARSVGADRLVVHGMLALLHVKQSSSSHIWASANVDGRQQFSAFFRLPAMQDARLELNLKSKGDGLVYSLRADDYLSVRGNHGNADGWFDDEVGPSIEHKLIAGSAVAARYVHFGTLFPFVTHQWIFLDALIFSDFLGDYFKRDMPVASGFVPVQMSHRVKYDAKAIEALPLTGCDVPTLRYSTKKIESAPGGAGRFGIAVLTVSIERSVLMQIEVGLFAKSVSPQQMDLLID
jgi:hypothetical protein